MRREKYFERILDCYSSFIFRKTSKDSLAAVYRVAMQFYACRIRWIESCRNLVSLFGDPVTLPLKNTKSRQDEEVLIRIADTA